MASDNDLLFMHNNGYGYKAIAEHYNLNKDSVRARVSRAKKLGKIIQDDLPNPLLDELSELRREITLLRNQLNEQEDERLYGHDLGKAWRLDGDWIIAGDVHANTINTDFMRRPLQIAETYLEKPRRFMLAGDFLNADSFGGYDSVYPSPSFGKELAAARAFLDMYLKVFDEIWIFVGNHDLRVTRKTNTAIMPEDLMRMISADPRIKVSHWGHAVIETPRGEYRVSHGSEYSVQQLNVADQMAQKYGQHIILWHEHHSSIGLDRFKRHIIVNGGGLFDSDSMAYTQIEDNKKARMANGFVMIREGYPYIFNDHFTDWQFWLSKAQVSGLRKSA